MQILIDVGVHPNRWSWPPPPPPLIGTAVMKFRCRPRANSLNQNLCMDFSIFLQHRWGLKNEKKSPASSSGRHLLSRPLYALDLFLLFFWLIRVRPAGFRGHRSAVSERAASSQRSAVTSHHQSMVTGSRGSLLRGVLEESSCTLIDCIRCIGSFPPFLKSPTSPPFPSSFSRQRTSHRQIS